MVLGEINTRCDKGQGTIQWETDNYCKDGT